VVEGRAHRPHDDVDAEGRALEVDLVHRVHDGPHGAAVVVELLDEVRVRGLRTGIGVERRGERPDAAARTTSSTISGGQCACSVSTSSASPANER